MQIADVLRGEDTLDEDEQLRVHVMAKSKSGKYYSIGWITASLMHADPEGARMAIEHIRWRREFDGIPLD